MIKTELTDVSILRKKKILIFSEYCWVSSGCWKVLKQYLKILSSWQNEYELDIHLCFLLDQPTIPNELESIPPSVRISYVHDEFETEILLKAWEKNNDKWRNIIIEQANNKILGIINNYAPNLIIDFDGNFARFDFFLQKYNLAKTIPIIKFIHTEIWMDIFEASRAYYVYTLQKDNIIVCLNQDMKKSYLKFVKNEFKNKEVCVLPNPINIDNITQLRGVEEDSETELLLNKDYILAIGRDDLLKNHREMLEIYAKLKALGIKHKLYILGMNKYSNSLNSQIQELGLENDVLILGIRSNPFRFLEKAKLFIHTAINEGFGMVLVESLACGTPVIAMDCPVGPREILDNGKYGMLISMHDQEQFIEKTLLLLNNPDVYKKYVDLSLERAKYFDISKISLKFKSMLERAFEYTK